MITTNGIWQGDNPLDYSLPLFVLQLTLVVVTTRLLVFALKPLRQPRVIAEILVLRKPFLIGCAFSLIKSKVSAEKAKDGVGTDGTLVLFLGVALAVTAFPVLARILAELKLLNTELGRVAMSSALVNDICAWILLALAIALAENDANSLASLWVILSSAAFVAFCIFAVRPAIMWMIRRTLCVRSLCIRADHTKRTSRSNAGGEAGRFRVRAPSPVVLRHQRAQDKHQGRHRSIQLVETGHPRLLRLYREGFWNCRGCLLSQYGVTRRDYAWFAHEHQGPRRNDSPQRRQGSKGWYFQNHLSSCIHTPRNVPTLINLLEATNPTKRSPICAYVLHLVELTGRASAMLIVHNTRKSGRPALNRTQAQSDHIINAFENYEQHATYVSVQPLTAISPYSSMHEDICNLAEDKRVAFIIIPFHKQQTVDGGMEVANPAFRMVNQNVLSNAPCSVGILVDRGLNGSTRLAANQVTHHIVLLFFGGPDDREALAYAWRMSEHPGITITVMRFIPGEDVAGTAVMEPSQDPNNPSVLTVVTDSDREKQLDEEYINEFRMRTASDESVIFREAVVNNGEETVAAIRLIDSIHDLFIVGRGQGMISPLTAGLTDWSECPELGAIGDLLASSDFAATVSVLVVQQYVGQGPHIDELNTPDSPRADHDEHFNRRQPPLPPRS